MSTPNPILSPKEKEEQKASKYTYPKNWSEYFRRHEEMESEALKTSWFEYKMLLEAITVAKMQEEFNILVESGRHPLEMEKLAQEDESYWIQLLARHFPPEEVEKRAWRMEKIIMKLNMKLQSQKMDKQLQTIQKLARQLNICGDIACRGRGIDWKWYSR